MNPEYQQIIGKAISDLAEGKQELLILKTKAAHLSERFEKISRGLAAPENMRFLESGLQMAQARSNPDIVLIHESDFKEADYDAVHQLVRQIRTHERRVEAMNRHYDELKTTFHLP